MKPAEFLKELEKFLKDLDEKQTETKTSAFQDQWFTSVRRWLRTYDFVLEHDKDEDKRDKDLPLLGFAADDLIESCRILAKSIHRGYSSPQGRLQDQARAKAAFDVAIWLMSLDRHGKGNLLGLRVPDRP